MIILGIDVPLIELAFAGIVIIIVILLEMIIIALLTSRQLGSAGSGVTVGRLTIPSQSLLPKVSPSLSSPLKSSPPKIAAAKAVSPPPVARSGKLALEKELARVQEQLSRLPSYAPQRAAVRTEVPSTGHSSSPEARKLERQAQDVDRLLRTIDKGAPAPPSSPQQEARAYQEVQRIAKKVEAQKSAPKGELLRLEEELVRLRKELPPETPPKAKKS